MPLTLISSKRFIDHVTPVGHPERPERAEVFESVAKAFGEDGGRVLEPRLATDEDLARVHTRDHITAIGSTRGRATMIDEDTYTSPDSEEIARLAAGAVLTGVDQVLDGPPRSRALVMVRPPGHHAEADRAMGFCLFNNAAVAAANARTLGAARVAVVDWDVHHGNGTQNIFYADPSVMYLSVHQYPFYPGTGAADEIGEGEGRGATVNVGLPAGCGDADLLAVFDRVFVPALVHFAPDLVLVSAGFDAHRADPLAGLRVTEAGYRAMTERLCWVADQTAGGRLVALLEGGYDLGALGRSLVEVLQVLEHVAAQDQGDAAVRDRQARRGCHLYGLGPGVSL